MCRFENEDRPPFRLHAIEAKTVSICFLFRVSNLPIAEKLVVVRLQEALHLDSPFRTQVVGDELCTIFTGGEYEVGCLVRGEATYDGV